MTFLTLGIVFKSRIVNNIARITSWFPKLHFHWVGYSFGMMSKNTNVFPFSLNNSVGIYTSSNHYTILQTKYMNSWSASQILIPPIPITHTHCHSHYTRYKKKIMPVYTYLVVRSTLRVMVALESYYLNITWIKLKLKIITLATSAYKADHNKITISFAEFLTKKSLKLYQKAKSVTITLTLSWMSHGAICFVI